MNALDGPGEQRGRASGHVTSGGGRKKEEAASRSSLDQPRNDENRDESADPIAVRDTTATVLLAHGKAGRPRHG